MANVSIGPAESGSSLTLAVVSSSATAITGVASSVGKIIRVYKLFLVAAGTTSLTFEDGTTGLSGAIPMAANGSIVLDNDGQPWFQTAPGNAFTLGNSGNILLAGSLYYTQQQY